MLISSIPQPGRVLDNVPIDITTQKPEDLEAALSPSRALWLALNQMEDANAAPAPPSLTSAPAGQDRLQRLIDHRAGGARHVRPRDALPRREPSAGATTTPWRARSSAIRTTEIFPDIPDSWRSTVAQHGRRKRGPTRVASSVPPMAASCAALGGPGDAAPAGDRSGVTSPRASWRPEPCMPARRKLRRILDFAGRVVFIVSLTGATSTTTGRFVALLGYAGDEFAALASTTVSRTTCDCWKASNASRGKPGSAAVL